MVLLVFLFIIMVLFSLSTLILILSPWTLNCLSTCFRNSMSSGVKWRNSSMIVFVGFAGFSESGFLIIFSCLAIAPMVFTNTTRFILVVRRKRNKHGKMKKIHIKMEHCWRQIRRRRWKVKMWVIKIANDANSPNEAEETCNCEENCVESRNVQLLSMIRFFPSSNVERRSLFFDANSVFFP